MELVETLRVRNTLGEGIQWDVETASAWWTDIQERTILRYMPSTGRLETFAMPERVGSFGLIEGSDDIVAAFESGFAISVPSVFQSQPLNCTLELAERTWSVGCLLQFRATLTLRIFGSEVLHHAPFVDVRAVWQFQNEFVIQRPFDSW